MVSTFSDSLMASGGGGGGGGGGNTPMKSQVTSSNLLRDVMSSISRHWTSFKSFWWVELKSALHKG